MLKTDYKDDILNTDVNVNRKFNIVRSNGTVVEQNVELRETTAFKQVGDSFGAKDINETNEAIVDAAGRLQTEVDNLKGSREVLRTLPNIYIPANADINTPEYLNIGSYVCINYGTALSISNIPSRRAFSMYVIAILGGSYGSESSAAWLCRLRIFIPYDDDDGGIYMQYVNSQNTAGVYSYGNWKRLISSSELTAIPNSDIDTILNS